MFCLVLELHVYCTLSILYSVHEPTCSFHLLNWFLVRFFPFYMYLNVLFRIDFLIFVIILYKYDLKYHDNTLIKVVYKIHTNCIFNSLKLLQINLWRHLIVGFPQVLVHWKSNRNEKTIDAVEMHETLPGHYNGQWLIFYILFH